LFDVIKNNQFRLDAEHYDPVVIENSRKLHSLGFDLVPLSELADIKLPGMFTRIWAKDGKHGVAYLNATDLMSFFATGFVAKERFLSRSSDVNMETLLIHEGMILLTCSGTIGRVFNVPAALDGYAGTHDIIRIVPHNTEIRGFIHAWLASELAQIQILSYTHGGQIDHVTADQIGAYLVPKLPIRQIREISAQAEMAARLQEESLSLMKKASRNLDRALFDGT